MNKKKTFSKAQAAKGVKRPKRKEPTEARLQAGQRLASRAVFARMGFDWIKSDGTTFTFQGRTGEIDDILIQENVLVLVERTTGKADSGHVTKKTILWNKILESSAEWVEHYAGVNQTFSDRINSSGYQSDEFTVHVCYISAHGISEELEQALTVYRFLDGTKFRYFDALSRTIQKSARWEFFNYLGVDLSRFGSRGTSAALPYSEYSGHLLPEKNSGYEKGFRVVSFYADPATLLKRAYVLRKDSWRDPDSLYQRILIPAKIRAMRHYLNDRGRVFVNNIIVTLPADTRLVDMTGKDVNHQNIPSHACEIKVMIPEQPNCIGLIDGQHRVFCYHESTTSDPLEKIISQQRSRQSLLVTGLIYPKTWKEQQQRDFEARLFLEINDTQARAKTLLKQSISVTLEPYSTTAIAKGVLNRLSRRGPLKDLLQSNHFDPADRVKTSSIVSFGMAPLVKTSGGDSLFFAWNGRNKQELLNNDKASELTRREALDSYLEFCVESINAMLIEIKIAVGSDAWTVGSRQGGGILTTTVINGFLVCMRRLAAKGRLPDKAAYKKHLASVSEFDFRDFKSSQWRELGDVLFSRYF